MDNRFLKSVNRALASSDMKLSKVGASEISFMISGSLLSSILRGLDLSFCKLCSLNFEE